jgi:hypothetical protein
MFEGTNEYLAKIQKRKMMAESAKEVDIKQTTGKIKATGREANSELDRKPEMKPKKAKGEVQPKNKEGVVKHSIKQCTPQKSKTPKTSLKVDKARPAKQLAQPKSKEGIVTHSIKQCEPGSRPSKSESIFVLAGIETILTSEDAKKGAIGALDIIKSYMGGKIDPAYQEFIDMFTNILKKNPMNADKVSKEVKTLGQQIPKK